MYTSPQKPLSPPSSNTVKHSLQINKTRLSIVHGNIVHEPSETIVNAANEDLWLGAGVAGAIDSAAGREVDLECKRIMSNRGKISIPIGSCVETGSGFLSERGIFKVIHAVGPIWKGGYSGEKESLEKCVLEALKITESGKFKSISFPAISSGIFGFPKKECAQCMIRTVVRFVEKKGGCELEEVRFVNYDWETVKVFSDVFRKEVLGEEI